MVYKSIRNLKSDVLLWRGMGKKIVTANGCFDLFHAGHLQFLQSAHAYGDCLIVGVNADATVAARKGAGRPVVPAKERAAIVAALRIVSGVFIFADPDPQALLRILRPDVHVTAAEYGPCAPEHETVFRCGGKVIYLPRRTDLPSTSQRIASLCSSPSQGSPSRKHA